MCKFFSVISDGKGKVLFFTLEQIQQIEKEGNTKKYNWNSHTSIADYNGIKGNQEDKWNKWEYDNENKVLKIDGGYNAKDDSKKVIKVIEKYIADNNALYCQKIYNSNSGNLNSGDRNSGYWNSGYLNTNTPPIRMFNKITKLTEKPNFPNYFYFDLCVWINISDITDEEKEKYYWYKTTKGFLKKLHYKEVFIKSFNEKCDKAQAEMTSSKPTEVGSFQRQEKKKMAHTNRTTKTVAQRKPLYLNCSLIEKSLMCGSLNGQPIAEPNYHFKTGDNYDEKRISTLQSNEVQHRCKNSNSKNWQSLQVQHQLSYNLDSEVQTKSITRQGGRSA